MTLLKAKTVCAAAAKAAAAHISCDNFIQYGMKNSYKRAAPTILICLSAVILIILIAVVPLSSCRPQLYFNASYYLVYYKIQYDAHSASSISSTVQSYGGAGYVICNDDKFYITVACYYSQADAQSVCANLKLRGLDCDVLTAEVRGYELTTRSAAVSSQTYLGNLNTLDSLSRLCYETANAIDGGTCDQNKAKSVLGDVLAALNGLLRDNPANCFTSEIRYLVTQCEDALFGYVYSRNVRALQAALIDCVLNIQLY